MAAKFIKRLKHFNLIKARAFRVNKSETAKENR